MSTSIALVLAGTRYTALLDGAATEVRSADGALVGRIWASADAEVLDACLPDALPAALELVRRLVAAEEAEAEAVKMAGLREAQGRRVAEAHWRMIALVQAVRADFVRAELAAMAAQVSA